MQQTKTLHYYIKRALFKPCLCQGFNVALNKSDIGRLVAKLLHVVVQVPPSHFKLESKQNTLLHIT